MSTLLERLGGEAAVTAVVDAFYDKVFGDPLLAQFFAQTDFPTQRRRQSKFLIQLMSGNAANPAEYMRTAHRRYVSEMGLGSKHFDAVGGHLVKTLQEFSVPEPLITEVAGALETLRPSVLNLTVPA